MGVIPIVERNGSWADMFSALGVTVLDDWSRLDAQRLADEELRITQGQGQSKETKIESGTTFTKESLKWCCA